ncbi:flavin reductase family protein [Aeromicrobium fastidiosum]|uniref:Flavin reductase family protein n=1 Tax=Aeromicrobium fastidiosum TaxID=52699 RepID=A0A641AKW6_9ACTN|nr:flavin reductase family protein [Aeromicrobium fastidiosum]KAA1376326.1 flavin reductase family protein [Aeromicrobium fastidiosum]MBP2391774.1 flavin reductase (DIM6/NTAB) family NADH-FMN oxidoreductase RutF [Aeromicrobium fastidiosum]
MRRVIHTDVPDAGAYALLNSLVVPRPIAWISTVSVDGIGNLAPHSFFSIACANPPIISWTSVGHKDTLANVLATGEFVVNLATLPDLDLVNATSASFDATIDECQELGIAMEPSERVAVPRVVSSPASLECALHSTIDLGDSVLVLGDVVVVTVDEDAMDGDHPDFAKLQTVSRLGINEWGLPPEVRAVDRPR